MSTVVLLHAFPVNAHLWDAQVRALVEAGHSVVAPDLPGFGGRPLPPGRPSMTAMARAVLDDWEGEAVVAGLSLGGYVLMEILRLAPQRVGGAVFIDTKATADTEQARQNRLRVADEVAALGQTRALAEVMLPNLLGATTRSTRSAVVTTVRRWIEESPAESVAWAQRAMAERPESVSTLAGYSGPAMLVWGDEDTISPLSDQAEMQSAMPQASLVTIPGSGHLSAIERPDAVSSALLEFVP